MEFVLQNRAELAEATALPTMSVLDLVLNTLEDNKAEEIVSIDLERKSQIADHMVIASGRSNRQVASLAEKLSERLKDGFGISPRNEGKANADWVLLDAGDVIIHIFRPEVREFYQLEKLWATDIRPDAAAQ